MAHYLDSRQELDATKVRSIVDSVLSGMTITQAGKKYGVSQGHVSSILYLRVWKHLIYSPEIAFKWREWLDKATKRRGQNKEYILRQFDKNIKIAN